MTTQQVAFSRVYHVPRSQVWKNSGGRQRGHIHLHVTDDFALGRIHRSKGQALCGRRGWYERPADSDDHGVCPRCIEIAGNQQKGAPDGL